jgi:hypothetical protein
MITNGHWGTYIVTILVDLKIKIKIENNIDRIENI